MKLIEVLQGHVLKRPPVWIMRQAGRYLPEYRQLRLRAANFIEFCLDPPLTIEATLQPLRRFDLDAAIIFSDILLIPYALGQQVEFVKGDGPRLGQLPTFESYQSEALLQRLQSVYEAIKQVRLQLPPDKALIGFAGAPWTVLTYMCEGGSSKTFDHTKRLCWGQPKVFQHLLDIIVDATIHHLSAQVKAGADVVQLFDSWSGSVPAMLRDQLVYQPTAKIVAGLRTLHPQIPIIGFPRGLSHLLQDYIDATQVSGAGLDTFTDPANIKIHHPLQGGLDPVLLLTGGQTMQTAVEHYLQSFSGKPYIFNLGHGILPQTPIENVHQLLSIIDEYEPQ